ncbi:MAG: tetratricopeptide repeat protein [Flavobacteriales bacterium]|nr:tetratricopeptide repeat protein [Flavobacteriales bacterium]
MSLTHPLKSILRIALVLLVIIHGLLLPAQSLDELTSKYERMPLDSLLALDGRSSEIRINAIVTNLIHDRYVYAGDAHEAMAAALRLMGIAERSGSDSLVVLAYAAVGSAFGMVNDISASLEHFNMALELARRSVNQNLQGFVAKEIGILYRNGGDHRTALRFYQQALALPQDQVQERSRIMSATGFSYLALGMLDSALYYAKEADVVRVPSDDPYGYVGYQGRLGEVYTALKDYDLAELYYKRALAADTFPVPRPIAHAAAGYARMLISTGRPQEALGMARKAYATIATSRDLSEILPVAQVLAEAFEANNTADSALAWMKVERALRDSVQGSENRGRLQAQLFQIQLKEQEVAKLKAEEVAARSHNIQFGIIALIVITLGIFLLIFSRTSVVGAKAIKNLSLIALLLFFEFINLLLHPFLDRITNHSPILMLLAMAAIAGLLIPLHHRMEKLITNMLVSKNNRVRLEAARRTIEELEGSRKDSAAS